jgi:hypothetical protein
MKRLILIRGLSGCGKTTMASLICSDDEDRLMISADDYFTSEDGVYSFDFTKLKVAHEWCKSEVASAMDEDWGVIVVHNTFTRKWEVDPYLNLASKNEYQVHILSLFDGGLSDLQLSQRGLHSLPTHQIQKQRRRWENDVYREQPRHDHYPRYDHPQKNSGDFQKKNRSW